MFEEHPSLREKEKKTAVESLEATKSEIERLRLKTASLKESAELIEAQIASLKVYEVIADLQASVKEFAGRYGSVLDKVEANADVEAELLAQARKVLAGGK